MFVETASLMLAAHLLRTYGDSGIFANPFRSTAHRLDHARLRRVHRSCSVHLADEDHCCRTGESQDSARSILREDIGSRRGDFAQALCQPVRLRRKYGRRSSQQAVACANSVKIGIFLAGELHASVPSRNRDYTPVNIESDRQ